MSSTYWNPFDESTSQSQRWFDYLKETSLAKYAADSFDLYLSRASAEQVDALEKTARIVCGALDLGFSGINDQLTKSLLINDRGKGQPVVLG